MIVVPNSFSLAQLAVLVGTGGALNGAKIHLFKNDVTPTVATELADLTEADFTGYAASSAVAWGSPFLDDQGEPVVVGSLKQFTAGSPLLLTNTIYGYMVLDGAGAVLLFAERFSSPKIIAVAGNSIVIVPTFGAISQAS